MQYSKCIECKNDGNMCKFIIVDALMAINNIEFLTNKSLNYMRFKPEHKINVTTDFICNGFIPKKPKEE